MMEIKNGVLPRYVVVVIETGLRIPSCIAGRRGRNGSRACGVKVQVMVLIVKKAPRAERCAFGNVNVEGIYINLLPPLHTFRQI